jgi:outer membrane lipoprotein-sorting protein
MNWALKKRYLTFLLLLLLIAPAQAWAQERPGTKQEPDPRQVFTELVRPYRQLIDYTVRIRAKVNMPTIRTPDFSATLYFKKPDRFHVETKSFAPIPRDSGVFNPFQFDPEKNLITYQRSENLNGTPADVFKVEPLETNTLVRYYHVWVGGNPGRVLQVESLSVKRTKGLVKPTYRIHEQGLEKWFLPEKIHIHLAFPEKMHNAGGLSSAAGNKPFSSSMRRLDQVSGEGDIFLSYSEWQINTGLDDSLFQNDKK